MEQVEEIFTAMKNKEHTVGVFYILKKTFNTIDHQPLNAGTGKSGIRGIGYSWLRGVP